MYYVKCIIALAVCVCIISITGCEGNSVKEEKVKDVDYTVVRGIDIPVQLSEKIEEKQTEPFKITYSDESSIYIAVGYGAQSTNGYSIMMEQMYETASNICVKTLLKGPDKKEKVIEKESHPYIVLMVQKTEKNIKFLD